MAVQTERAILAGCFWGMQDLIRPPQLGHRRVELRTQTKSSEAPEIPNADGRISALRLASHNMVDINRGRSVTVEHIAFSASAKLPLMRRAPAKRLGQVA